VILDEAAVRRHLRMEDLIPAMARALADLSAGRVVQPGRQIMPVAEHGGFFAVMPAYAGTLGAKLVAFYPENRGIPTHHALVVLFRPETGEPLVTMDGRLITEMRTGAVSAVATQHLARPDSSVLAILGSGVQAQSHLEALRLVRGFREVRVWRPPRARRCSSASGSRPAPTSNAVGAVRPDWRELDDDVLRRARLYVESREAATREAGDVIAAREPFAEIGEVVAGTRPGRRAPEEITLFKSVGVAVEDVVAADLIYRSARM